MTAVHALVVAHVGNVKEMTNKPWWYASEHPYVCVYDGMQHIVHVLHSKMPCKPDNLLCNLQRFLYTETI